MAAANGAASSSSSSMAGVRVVKHSALGLSVSKAAKDGSGGSGSPETAFMGVADGERDGKPRRTHAFLCSDGALFWFRDADKASAAAAQFGGDDGECEDDDTELEPAAGGDAAQLLAADTALSVRAKALGARGGALVTRAASVLRNDELSSSSKGFVLILAPPSAGTAPGDDSSSSSSSNGNNTSGGGGGGDARMGVVEPGCIVLRAATRMERTEWLDTIKVLRGQAAARSTLTGSVRHKAVAAVTGASEATAAAQAAAAEAEAEAAAAAAAGSSSNGSSSSSSSSRRLRRGSSHRGGDLSASTGSSGSHGSSRSSSSSSKDKRSRSRSVVAPGSPGGGGGAVPGSPPGGSAEKKHGGRRRRRGHTASDLLAGGGGSGSPSGDNHHGGAPMLGSAPGPASASSLTAAFDEVLLEVAELEKGARALLDSGAWVQDSPDNTQAKMSDRRIICMKAADMFQRALEKIQTDTERRYAQAAAGQGPPALGGAAAASMAAGGGGGSSSSIGGGGGGGGPFSAAAAAAAVRADPAFVRLSKQFEAVLDEAEDLDSRLTELLPADQRARKNIMNEILATERSYVQGLATLDAVFYRPMCATFCGPQVRSKKHAIAREVVDAVFGNVDEIRDLHARFLMNLEATMNFGAFSDATFTQAFDGILEQLKPVYSQYVANYDRAHASLGNLRELRAFSRFLEEAHRDPVCNLLAIEDFLIMPVQRLPRYEMLLADFLKHTVARSEERLAVEGVLERVRDVSVFINERKKEADGRARLRKLDDRLHVDKRKSRFLPQAAGGGAGAGGAATAAAGGGGGGGAAAGGAAGGGMMEPGRQLIREGFMTHIATSGSNAGKRKRFYVFVFNDMVLISQQQPMKQGKGGSTMRYDFQTSAPLDPKKTALVEDIARDPLWHKLFGPKVESPDMLARAFQLAPTPVVRKARRAARAAAEQPGGRDPSKKDILGKGNAIYTWLCENAQEKKAWIAAFREALEADDKQQKAAATVAAAAEDAVVVDGDDDDDDDDDEYGALPSVPGPNDSSSGDYGGLPSLGGAGGGGVVLPPPGGARRQETDDAYGSLPTAPGTRMESSSRLQPLDEGGRYREMPSAALQELQRRGPEQPTVHPVPLRGAVNAGGDSSPGYGSMPPPSGGGGGGGGGGGRGGGAGFAAGGDDYAEMPTAPQPPAELRAMVADGGFSTLSSSAGEAHLPSVPKNTVSTRSVSGGLGLAGSAPAAASRRGGGPADDDVDEYGALPEFAPPVTGETSTTATSSLMGSPASSRTVTTGGASSSVRSGSVYAAAAASSAAAAAAAGLEEFGTEEYGALDALPPAAAPARPTLERQGSNPFLADAVRESSPSSSPQQRQRTSSNPFLVAAATAAVTGSSPPAAAPAVLVKCSRCDLNIAGRGVSVAGKTLHETCFTCTECDGSLVGGVRQRGSNLVCLACDERLAPKCHACHTKLDGQFVEVGGGKHGGEPLKLHARCFACSDCGRKITSAYKFDPPDTFTCGTCARVQAKRQQQQP